MCAAPPPDPPFFPLLPGKYPAPPPPPPFAVYLTEFIVIELEPPFIPSCAFVSPAPPFPTSIKTEEPAFKLKFVLNKIPPPPPPAPKLAPPPPPPPTINISQIRFSVGIKL